MITAIIGIVLSLTALGLIYWLRKDQQIDNGLHAAELEHTHQGMNALMNDFNNYQVETDRKISELEKQLEVERNTRIRQLDILRKQLPSIIGKVVGQIEFAQDTINRK